MSFAERIKNLRSERNVSQAEVAAAVGIAWRNYQKIESGASLPNYNTLLAIADFFAVAVDYLMGRTDKREVNR